MVKSKYPSKAMILKTEPEIPQIIKEVTMIWKREFLKEWKALPKRRKIERLKLLATAINAVDSPKTRKELHFELSNSYCYGTRKKTIYIDKEKPSIVSTLHELGHHLYGKKELTACRFSVWLFKECFPTLYNNLQWKKHLLV